MRLASEGGGSLLSPPAFGGAYRYLAITSRFCRKLLTVSTIHLLDAELKCGLNLSQPFKLR